MKWLLLVAFLAPQGSAPSQFTINGFDSEAKCERAKFAIRTDAKGAGRLIVFTSCMPGNDAP